MVCTVLLELAMPTSLTWKKSFDQDRSCFISVVVPMLQSRVVQCRAVQMALHLHQPTG